VVIYTDGKYCKYRNLRECSEHVSMKIYWAQGIAPLLFKILDLIVPPHIKQNVNNLEQLILCTIKIYSVYEHKHYSKTIEYINKYTTADSM